MTGMESEGEKVPDEFIKKGNMKIAFSGSKVIANESSACSLSIEPSAQPSP